MNKGLFITLEGCEGCGKTTQARLLSGYLTENGYAVVLTREPGGTRLAEAVRKVLLDPGNRISPLAELLLYEAGRAQHVEEVILPALRAGKVVVCDRFTDATLAYQGYARGLDLAVIKNLNGIAAQGLSPDLTVYLDINVKAGLRRAKTLKKDDFVPGGGDRLERENLRFHRRVREGYRALAAREPKRIVTIPTAETIEKTQEQILAAVRKALSRRAKGLKKK
ncbi:MAG: dTMP kinase [Endomicrobiales bacterium]